MLRLFLRKLSCLHSYVLILLDNVSKEKKECFSSQRSTAKETELNLPCNLSSAEPSSLSDPHLMFLAAQEQDSISEK